MKTLLNKKLAIAFAAVVLFISVTKAQIPDRLKNLPPFKLRASLLSSLHNQHMQGKLNAMHSSNNALCLTVQTTLGGSSYDEGHKIIPTKDGGFMVCGETSSNDGDFHVRTGDVGFGFGEAYIARYNKFRKLEWIKTFGGTGDENFIDIEEASCGGYIALGFTSSNDGDVSGNHGGYDAWVVKLSTSGKIEWQKCLGGTGDEFGESLVQTFSGGYAIAGLTNSNDGDVSGNHNTDGNFDGWFIKVGPKGNLLFQHCYGGSDYDDFTSMVASDLGSFILHGATSSVDGDVSGNHGGGDAWVVKLNAIGKIVWLKALGGSGYEGTGPGEITTTTDGNVVMDCFSTSADGDVKAQNDTAVSFVAKLNSKTGALIWSKSYAEPSVRVGFGIFATSDGGTVETGMVGPGFFDATNDALISKFDKHGNEEWYKRLGGSDFDGAFAGGYQSSNGDLNILCESNSVDGDVKGVHHGNTDEWIIKLGRCGNDLNNDLVSVNNAIASVKNNTILLSNYPNPVSNSTTISFTLPQSQKVSIQIFDMNGRLVKTLADEQMQTGAHQLTWDAKDEKGNAVNRGIYLLKMQAGNYMETKKISVVK